MADERVRLDLPVVLEQSSHAEGRRWLDELPTLLDAAITNWDLELGTPFASGSAAWAAPVVRRSDGVDAVLKVTMPHREARYEGEGLRLWNGEGTVKLLAEDRSSFTLLIERCRPGLQMKDDPAPVDDRLVAAAQVLRRLWARPVPDSAPFETIEGVAQIDAPADGQPRRDVLRRRFELVSSIVDEPADRMSAWATARSVEASLWYVSLDRIDEARESLIWAKAFADVAGL